MSTGGEAFVPDGSWLPFMLEEVISYGAGKVVLDRSSDLVALPHALSRRVDVCDLGPPTKRTAWFLQPVADAIGHRPKERYFVVKQGSDVDALLLVSRSLTTWLLGRQERLQLPLMLRDVLRAIRQLKRACASHRTATARLSLIEGVFRTYSKEETSALVVVAGAHRALHEMLDALLDDEAFHDYSVGTLELGVLDRAAAAKRKILRAIRHLAGKKLFRGLLREGSRVVARSAQVELPDVSEIQLSDDEPYAPAIARVGGPMRSALRRWCAAHPAFLPLHGAHAELVARVDDVFTLEGRHRSVVMGYGHPPKKSPLA